MTLKLNFVLFIISFLLVNNIFSQESTPKDTSRFYVNIDIEDFKPDLLAEAVRANINKYRIANGLDSLKNDITLSNAAEDQSAFMADKEMLSLKQKGKKKTTGKRVIYYGGSNFAEEVVCKMSAKKGNLLFTYKKVADDITFKFLNSKKTSMKLLNPEFIFFGVGSTQDLSGKKIYTSIVAGNYKSFNNGANRRKEMDVQYSTKKYGLKPYDYKTCKKCDKYKNIEDLQKGLYVNDGIIYFKTNNLKAFRKIIKGSKDGIAVDVIQKEQYTCTGDNIIDNNLVNKGVLVKRIWAKKIYKKNLITDKKERKTKLDVMVGKMPKGIEDDYELNLVIIVNKKVCANIPQSFIEDGGVEYMSDLDLLADTVTINANFVYTPLVETSVLNFRIPFERGKFTYNPADIEPFLESLKEPEFVIDNLKITAYSSIEGNAQTNKTLQKKRAASIVESLNSRQQSEMKTTIETKENWDEFKSDVSSTSNSDLASMNIEQARAAIKSRGLTKELEPILENHRYAKLEMSITYDIAGDKEQAFVVSRFNKAIKEGDLPKALAVQKYILKKIIDEDYDEDAVKNQEIPETATYAGLMMNKIWMLKYVEQEDLESGVYCEMINTLYNLVPSNNYIRYNKTYCDVANKKFKKQPVIYQQQKDIDALYEETSISKETIDLLNLELQFRVIEAIDTSDTESELVVISMDKIKEIFNIKEADWQNSLKLAYIFMKHEDYAFATKLLEPFVYEEKVFEELIFTYVSLCSKSQAKMYSNRFAHAMQKAHEINSVRYCEMFSGKKFPMQVLENKHVKKDYCNYCNK